MASNSDAETCQLAEPTNNQSRRIGILSCKQDKASWEYDECSGFGILKKEEHDAILTNVSDIYDKDPLNPRDRYGAPPVKRVKAIYGINLETEVGAVYKRRRAIAVNKNKVRSMHKLDLYAKLGQSGGLDGFKIEKGVLMETRDTPQMIDGPTKFRSSAVAKEFMRRSGDGNVPYYSLQFCRTWERQCLVSVSELDGAKHRAILADKRFHKILTEYVTMEEDG
mmetsp:Transcript_19801/g.37219  ORF Transcript_19801/g.37219 Transcript_19801/m.37219 type:complete len:223 (+) Transcript_19801:946-1614(+)